MYRYLCVNFCKYYVLLSFDYSNINKGLVLAHDVSVIILMYG